MSLKFPAMLWYNGDFIHTLQISHSSCLHIKSLIPQDSRGTPADAPDNPAILAVKKIRELFPDLLVACDVCLCPYTDHGHCGILNPDGTINNPPSIERLADVALAYAMAGNNSVNLSCY